METEYDAAVVGGSFAGLSAALYLARGRRRVALFDSGLTRNRFAQSGHGFLGMDGLAPADMRMRGRAEVLAYPSVTLHETAVTAIRRQGEGFVLDHAGGAVQAQRLILAYGMRDRLPELPGLAECWGISAMQCPYCHGYEAADLPTGFLMADPSQAEHVLLLADWTADMTLFLNGHPLGAEQRHRLESRGIALAEGRVAALEHESGRLTAVQLEDGSRIARKALYLTAPMEPAAPFAEALGCRMAESPLGRFVVAGDRGQTSQPGIWAAGDLTRSWFSAVRSAAEGMLAGVDCHRSLVFGLAQAA